jgi:hypothetical protein
MKQTLASEKTDFTVFLNVFNIGAFHYRHTVFAEQNLYVRFEVFTAVTMKNDVFWDVTPCGFCKNRRL